MSFLFKLAKLGKDILNNELTLFTNYLSNSYQCAVVNNARSVYKCVFMGSHKALSLGYHYGYSHIVLIITDLNGLGHLPEYTKQIESRILTQNFNTPPCHCNLEFFQMIKPVHCCNLCIKISSSLFHFRCYTCKCFHNNSQLAALI